MKARCLFRCLLLLIITPLLTSFSPSDSEYLINEPNTPVFSAEGLHYENILTSIFRGDFVNITFDRDDATFVLLLQEYINAYASHCSGSLPSDKRELTRQKCVTWNVTTNGYGMEVSRYCVKWIAEGTGLYASPDMYHAKIVIENLQAGDALRNMYKMMSQKNPIGDALSLVEKANTIKADMISLLKINSCNSAGLKRFQENLRLFALNKQPIRLDGSSTTNKTISANNQNFSKLTEDLVYEHSKTWAMNKYERGSISNAVVTSKDGRNQPAELKAKYIYTGWRGRSTGSVRITFNDGLPDCLYFFDFPNTCRSANRKIVSDLANGHYQN